MSWRQIVLFPSHEKLGRCCEGSGWRGGKGYRGPGSQWTFPKYLQRRRWEHQKSHEQKLRKYFKHFLHILDIKKCLLDIPYNTFVTIFFISFKLCTLYANKYLYAFSSSAYCIPISFNSTIVIFLFSVP